MKSRRFLLRLLLLAFFLPTWTTACARSAPATDHLAITLHASRDTQPAFVEITGLSPSELASLHTAGVSARDWTSLLRVSVDAALPPVEGRFAVTATALTFTPLYPFDPGRPYQVTFDPAHLPRPRSVPAISSVVHLDAAAVRATTRVTAVYPAGDVLPANTLRLYVEFSAPMGRGAARRFVRLLDEQGGEVPDPFLPVEADFWNGDHTRYTLFFDPGRVKQGILPNRQMGRPLEPGRQYTLEVSSEWRDAEEQPLTAVYRRRFRVGAAAERPLSLKDWTIVSPAARTREPLIVTFPTPLDHGLLGRALGVEAADGRSIEGDVTIEGADSRWLFTPRVPWVGGQYQFVASSILEDPAGNRIGRAFEVEISNTSLPTPDVYRTGFSVVDHGF